MTWIPVHFRTDPPPIECAGPKLLAAWPRYAGKEVFVQHVNDRQNMRKVYADTPNCECEHYFRLRDFHSENGQQAVVCRKCLEMD
jgi:hypothetical protein